MGALLPEVRLRTALRSLVAVVLLGLITHGTYAGTGDEPHYLAIAHSVAFDRDFDVSNNYGASEPLIAAGDLEAGPHVRQGRGGIVRPVHDVGLPLLLAPVVRVLVPLVRALARTAPPDLLRRVRVTPTILYRHALSLCMIVLAVVLATLLFDTFMSLGASPHAAFAAALLVMLSPPLMIYSVLIFTELTSALLCLVIFRRVALPDRDRPPAVFGPDVGHGWTYWFITGSAIGLLLLIHVRNVGLVLALTVLALHVMSRTRAWRNLGALAAGLATLVSLRTALTYHFWGTLVTTPHGRLGSWTGLGDALGEAGIRLAGLFLDQEYGLIVYGPIYALALSGLIVMSRPAAGRILFVSVCYLAFVLWPVTNVHGWTGQWSPPARMLMPVVPLLALPLVAGIRALPRPIVLIVIALQIVVSAYMWQNPKNLWNDGDGLAAACSRGNWPVCAYLPSFARHGL